MSELEKYSTPTGPIGETGHSISQVYLTSCDQSDHDPIIPPAKEGFQNSMESRIWGLGGPTKGRSGSRAASDLGLPNLTPEGVILFQKLDTHNLQRAMEQGTLMNEIQVQGQTLRIMLSQSIERQVGLETELKALTRKLEIQGAELCTVKEVARIQKSEIDRKEEMRKKKKNAKTQPVRDAISLAQFHQIMLIPNGSKYTGARSKVGILILYITGLRISNLLTFNVRHCKELLRDGGTTIRSIKRGKTRFPLILTPGHHALLHAYKSEIDILCGSKTLDKPLFSALDHPDIPVSTRTLLRDINPVLGQFSKDSGFHVKSHSLRASFITDSLKNNSLELTQEVIGHAKPSTTSLYDRRIRGESQLTEFRENLDSARGLEENSPLL